MTVLPLLPDAELVVINHVRTHPTLTPLMTGGRVGTVLRAERPFVQVNRVAGAPADGQEDLARVQISVWHTSDALASELARTIVATMPGIMGPNVRAWEVVLGPFSQPDEDNKRYVLDVELLIYAED